MRLLVVGGSDAGISAALRAREDVPDWRRLAHRSLEELEATGMRLLLDHTAHRVDPAIRQVTVTDPHGHKHALDYDRLIVGTGAVRFRPPIPGLDLPRAAPAAQHGRRIQGAVGPPGRPARAGR